MEVASISLMHYTALFPCVIASFCIYARFIKNQYLRILLGSVILILLTGCFNGRIYLGSGIGIIELKLV